MLPASIARILHGVKKETLFPLIEPITSNILNSTRPPHPDHQPNLPINHLRVITLPGNWIFIYYEVYPRRRYRSETLNSDRKQWGNVQIGKHNYLHSEKSMLGTGPGPIYGHQTGPPALLEIYTRATMDLVSAHQNGNYKICKT